MAGVRVKTRKVRFWSDFDIAKIVQVKYNKRMLSDLRIYWTATIKKIGYKTINSANLRRVNDNNGQEKRHTDAKRPQSSNHSHAKTLLQH